jgi:hypothetical protein
MERKKKEFVPRARRALLNFRPSRVSEQRIAE